MAATVYLMLATTMLAFVMMLFVQKLLAGKPNFWACAAIACACLLWLNPWLHGQVRFELWNLHQFFVETVHGFVRHLTKIVVGLTVLAIGVTCYAILWREWTKPPREEDGMGE